jgi:hypothetical protein
MRLALSKGPNGVGVSFASPEEENRSSFRNVVFSSIQNSGPWTTPRNPVILGVTHHRQNPLDSKRLLVSKLCLPPSPLCFLSRLTLRPLKMETCSSETSDDFRNNVTCHTIKLCTTTSVNTLNASSALLVTCSLLGLLHPEDGGSKTPWPESTSKLYRLSDRRLSAKLVPTFADRGCQVVSVTDPYSRILDSPDRSRYFSFQVAPKLYSRNWVDPIPDPLLTKSGSAGN